MAAKRCFMIMLFALFMPLMTVYAQDFSFAPSGRSLESPIEKSHVVIDIVPEKNYIEPGETISLVLRQDIDPHWHTYWTNPGDSGAAMRVNWTVPDGFIVGDMKWPVPKPIPFQGLVNFGYEDSALFVQTITAPNTLAAGPVSLSADIEVLVCEEICIPEFGTYEVILNDGVFQQNDALVSEAYAAQPTMLDWPATFWEKDGQYVIQFDLEQPNLIAKTGETMVFDVLPYEWGVIDNTAPAEIIFPGDKTQMITKKRGERDLTDIEAMNVLITFMPVADKENNVSAHAIELTATPNPDWVQHRDENVAYKDNQKRSASRITFLPALLAAFLGGIILNLMPCVFPILSMKALSLVQLSGKEKRHIRLNGLFYTAGILISFAVIAGILIILKSIGAEIGWGFQLQNPLFVLGLIYLLYLVGLNLSGVYEISPRLSNIGSRAVLGDGHQKAFLTGILATLVATPCTAPFMGIALGYALTQPPVIGLCIFMMLGFGLALPYLLICFIPAAQKMLPKPGAWMETFKQCLAFPIYVTVIWLMSVYIVQTYGLGFVVAAFSLLGITIAMWMLGRFKEALRLKVFAICILLLSLIAGFILTVPRTFDTDVSVSKSEAYFAYSHAVYEELLSGDTPVFVNMTADWCITCKVNERGVLKRQAVEDLFQKKNIAYLKGDWTNRNSEISQYLERYGRSGVPLYVYYGARNQDTGARPDGVVLPQLLTVKTMRNVLQ